jgi:hypothetical protein
MASSDEQISNNGGFDPASEQDPNNNEDEGPSFIDTNDAVEVNVDLENEPMEEDVDESMAEGDGTDGDASARPPVKDMAQVSLSCHTGPVYCTSFPLCNLTICH